MYILQEINLHILLSPITYTTQTLDWGDSDVEMVLYLASQPTHRHTLATTGNWVKIALLCEVKRDHDNDPSLLVIVMTLRLSMLTVQWQMSAVSTDQHSAGHVDC